MADHGLDGGPASHLAANGVAVDAADGNPCELFEIGDDGTE
jgi:hypothetical protein